MKPVILCIAAFFSVIVYGQDTLSQIKSSRNVVTIEISDSYFPFIYINDSTVRRNTLSDIAVLHKTGWTEADIKRLSVMMPLRTSVNYISKSMLAGNTTAMYQPNSRNHELYDFMESAWKNSKVRAPEMLKQAKKTNEKAVSSTFDPWILVILDLSTGYTEIEIRKELKKRKLDRVYFDIRGKAPKHFDEEYNYSDAPAPPPPPPVSEIASVVDENADFPGGREALMKFMEKNLVYPESAKPAGIKGYVYVKFVVARDGQISNVMVTRKIPNCQECDKEAIRFVKSMPNWIPGKIKGQAVSSYFNFPVEFRP